MKKDKDGYFIEHGKTSVEEDSTNNMWLVIRSLKDINGKVDYKIKYGD